MYRFAVSFCFVFDGLSVVSISCNLLENELITCEWKIKCKIVCIVPAKHVVARRDQWTRRSSNVGVCVGFFFFRFFFVDSPNVSVCSFTYYTYTRLRNMRTECLERPCNFCRHNMYRHLFVWHALLTFARWRGSACATLWLHSASACTIQNVCCT